VVSESKVKNKKILFDGLLVLALLAVALSVFLIVTLTREQGNAAAVYVDGELVGEYPLTVDCELAVGDGSNVIVISGGEVYMKHASCPDGLCMKMGRKSRVGESIDCLPNRVRVEVIGEGDELLGTS